MNFLTLIFFIFIVAVLSAVIVKVNTSDETDTFKAVINAVIGICLTAAIMFLPFGNDSPKTLFGRAVNFVRPKQPEKVSVSVTEPLPQPVKEIEAEEEEELPDFIVYECDDYYIGMDKEEHIMQIYPSEERLEDTKATEKLAYYSFSGEYQLDGHTLNVYSARLSGDPGFVCIVLFEEYHQGKTNPGFTENDCLFRLYDEDKGYMYGFAYEYDNVEYSRGYAYMIGSKRVAINGMYEALKLDKKYFD